MNYHSKNTVIFLVCTALLFSCTSDVGDDSDSGIATCDGVNPIENSQDANYVAAHIIYRIEDVVNELPEGTYNMHEVSGYFGTMEITGIVSRTVNESCGVGCVTRYNNHEIVSRMSNYASATSPTVITGDINYSDSTGLQVVNDSSSVIGAISVTDNGTNISYKRTYITPDCIPRENGVLDTIISISSSGESSSYLDQSGVITSTGGTFIF